MSLLQVPRSRMRLAWLLIGILLLDPGELFAIVFIRKNGARFYPRVYTIPGFFTLSLLATAWLTWASNEPGIIQTRPREETRQETPMGVGFQYRPHPVPFIGLALARPAKPACGYMWMRSLI